ncbi:MAG: transposase [Xanthomonadales bacterium]|nr:transposase [Xanthomonadales bacterium]
MITSRQIILCSLSTVLLIHWIFDGSFFKASNSRSRHISGKQLDRELAKLDAQIVAYFSSMDEADTGDGGAVLTASELAKKLEQLKVLQHQQAVKQAQREDLKSSGQSQRALTDPDARLLKKCGQQVIGYNVQIAVDSKHHLIAAHDVTRGGNDFGQLTPLAEQVKAVLEMDHIEAGYYTRKDIKASVDAGITPYVKPSNSSNSKANGRFSKVDFDYDVQTDNYRCPANSVMRFVGTGKDKSGHLLRYYRSYGCTECPLKTKCIKPGVAYPRISRWEYEAIMEQNGARLKVRPEMMKVRMSLAEHPFGTLKQHMGATHFLT